MDDKLLRVQKKDTSEIAELKKIIVSRNLSVPIVSEETGYSTTSIYRWLRRNTGYSRKINDLLVKARKIKAK